MCKTQECHSICNTTSLTHSCGNQMWQRPQKHSQSGILSPLPFRGQTQAGTQATTWSATNATRDSLWAHVRAYIMHSLVPVLTAMRTRSPLNIVWRLVGSSSRSPAVIIRAAAWSPRRIGHSSFSKRCWTCMHHATCNTNQPDDATSHSTLRWGMESSVWPGADDRGSGEV